jgi:predicted DNA-binding transcriptional regulator AlpA
MLAATNKPTSNRVVTEAEAAEKLSVSTYALKRLSARSEGPPRIRVSPRRVGYRERDLDAYIESL